ncbi:hypothetical protein AAIB33_03730 [Microbacterium sp. AZCO]|uniref:hypothetical protein n=1 Tax=Microbacterium sp. AZCO TaxID=3142976 RepID=UPI0031F43394
MSTDRALLPLACTLTDGAGAEQLAAWRRFNDDYLTSIDRDRGRLIAHYENVGGAVGRLSDLVRTEQSCCAFATWSIHADHSELSLTVTGSDDALATLTFLEQRSSVSGTVSDE